MCWQNMPQLSIMYVYIVHLNYILSQNVVKNAKVEIEKMKYYIKEDDK